jgi:hypothetical protein
MKKLVFVVFIAILATSAFAAPAKNVPTMIGIHVGPAHPAFNEALYPDIKVFYLPDYQVNVVNDKKDFNNDKAGLASGQGLVADWFEAKGFQAYPRYKSFLFDKTGVCVFEGWLLSNSKSANEERWKLQNTAGNFIGDKKALKVSMDDYVQKGKTMKANEKKDLIKDKDYGGGKVFDLTVVNASGESRKLTDIVAESGPSLVFFFTIPADAPADQVSKAAQSAAMIENAGNATSPLGFLGAMMNANVGHTYTSILDQIELDFFGYLVNKAR